MNLFEATRPSRTIACGKRPVQKIVATAFFSFSSIQEIYHMVSNSAICGLDMVDTRQLPMGLTRQRVAQLFRLSRFHLVGLFRLIFDFLFGGCLFHVLVAMGA